MEAGNTLLVTLIAVYLDATFALGTRLATGLREQTPSCSSLV